MRARVSFFSGSVSRCALTVEIFTFIILDVNLSLTLNTSSSFTSLLIGSFRRTFLPRTHASDCSDRRRSSPGI